MLCAFPLDFKCPCQPSNVCEDVATRDQTIVDIYLTLLVRQPHMYWDVSPHQFSIKAR